MNTQLELGKGLEAGMLREPAGRDAGATRQVMNGKPVFVREAKSVINFKSNFEHKLLCDGATFSAGDACVYKCAFCYVPDMMRKLRALPQMAHVEGEHENIVVRRGRAAEIARQQLSDRFGRPKFKEGRIYHSPSNRLGRMAKVIYASPLVDVAGNMELVRETVEICKVILELTDWDIRLLSKSNLLPRVAQELERDGRDGRDARDRIIYGVSTGTLDDGLAKGFEGGAPLISKRLASLHWLQDNGFRTFGMICPSLPQADYNAFAREAAAAIRAERCEHVWAEVMNLRGESFTRTVGALRAGSYYTKAKNLERVSTDKEAWEGYARATFEAHAGVLPKGKLRFLQYVSAGTRPWWTERAGQGAVVL